MTNSSNTRLASASEMAKRMVIPQDFCLWLIRNLEGGEGGRKSDVYHWVGYDVTQEDSNC